MNEEIEIVRGSGNVFADLGLPEAASLQLKAQLVAKIIRRLNEMATTIRAAAAVAQCDPADLQRIRNADVTRFTIDRLLKIAFRLGCQIEWKIKLPKAA
jgi:predicted XRE-type DNA-binding protein